MFAFSFLRPAFPFRFSLPLATFFLLLLVFCFFLREKQRLEKEENSTKEQKKKKWSNGEATNTVFKNYKTKH